MTKRDVLSVAFKIIGVYSIMTVIAYLPTIFMTLTISLQKSIIMGLDSIARWYLIVFILFPITMLIFAYILIMYGEQIAEKLIKVDTALINMETTIKEKSIFIISLRIMGALQLAEAIPIILKTLIPFWMVSSKHLCLNSYLLTTSPGFELISGLVRLAIGFYLVSGAKDFVERVFPEAANQAKAK